MSHPPYRRVAVVGVGLIGGSVALALRRRGLAAEVVGVARTADGAAAAVTAGVVESATPDLEEGCRGADVVLVATPVGQVAEHARRAARVAAEGALVTDAGSTKQAIVEELGDGWPAGRVFVGAHPLAGDHRKGPAAAREGLFDGAVTVLTPTGQTPPAALHAARRFWEALGARIVELSPAEHDRLLAAASHVPHVAAAALAATTPEGAHGLTAGGWRDTTRVAAGSPPLWRDILMTNRGPIAAGLRRLAEELEAYAAALDGADGHAVERLLEEGRRRRDALAS